MKKNRLLCILHRSPPAHGASKVGDYIASSAQLAETFECRFITIKSSDTIGDIGKVNLKKFYLVAELYLKVLCALIVFRPDKIYFTASIRSVAFYRDLLISTLWKLYQKMTAANVYYHYHTKGVDAFVSASARNLSLTRFFLRDVHLIVLSPLLAHDFTKVKTYHSLHYLPNGIEDPLTALSFETILEQKYNQPSTIRVLYLAHMMKDKGYVEALTLASQTKEQPIHYHFAGSWQSPEDEHYFHLFIQTHALENSVTYHGFISGEEKKALFQKAHLLLYPSKNDAFPLTLLESIAYGIPVIATPEGSIAYILDEQSGIIIHDINDLLTPLERAIETLINPSTARYCRQRYCEHFTQQQFEENLIDILKEIK